MTTVAPFIVFGVIGLYLFGVFFPKEALNAARGKKARFDLTEASFSTALGAFACFCIAAICLFVSFSGIPLWLEWVMSALWWAAATYNIIVNRDCADAWRDRDAQAQQPESTAAVKS